MMKASLGVGAMFPRKIDWSYFWVEFEGGVLSSKPNPSHPLSPPPPPSFLCALYCVVPTAEIIMDIGNL